jgi:hypothetical protein
MMNAITNKLSDTTRVPQPINAAGSMWARAFQLADMYAVTDIESYCTAVVVDGARHYDSRPWLDPHEQPPEFLDMAQKAIEYALDRNLAMRHPTQVHMLRVLRFPVLTEV